MFQFDICESDDEESTSLCHAYRVTLITSSIACLINFLLCLRSFTKNVLTNNSSIFRTLVVIDCITCLGFILDSCSTLLNVSAGSRNTSVNIEFPSENIDKYHVYIYDCAIYKPFLFLIAFSRQWISMIMLVIGLERILFIIYPLWFRAMRIRRTPIILFTLSFSFISCVIAYTNSIIVCPTEETNYACEATWAFGTNYGWCQSIMIILFQFGGLFFSFYALYVSFLPSSILHFGNQYEKLIIERRRIFKSIFFIALTVIFNATPQGILLIFYLRAPNGLAATKQLISVITCVKCIGNLYLYLLLTQTTRKVIQKLKDVLNSRQKRRVATGSTVTATVFISGIQYIHS